MNLNALEILRESELRNRIKLSHSTIWRLVRDGQFPLPVQLSSRAKGWRTAEIEEWLKGRTKCGEARKE
jgi:prophage regulatory protein